MHDDNLEYLDPPAARRVKPPTPLLPCPCCGGQPELWEDPQMYSGGVWMGYFIRCKGCALETTTMRDANPGIKRVSSQWNRRDWRSK
jgi:hypothetical protein